ncbi:AQG_2a_G0002800.mRNA.1.CDS.1 [Saccharomyces cerevisiae]|nr:CNB_1a_G0002550.mRNA.1.CDS.1 [Saccharomyces cerevisiae]CAI4257637.1 ABA_G0002570.mRNA.1.CDS.1 [Saccharomyces cerevisiae]CAI4262698.1 AQG_2a_G0002800.mRNA.1.CDS.1 [Saccharomyces cerevisiae]CAI4265126.1 AEH_G0002550.mRNA.1.CDS.1 [Saccharomyces cerevisiae]CAI4265852.1 ACH_G0002570.mRNA.1.CDS.1 [Saccharomyces cerevisiae]
MLDKLSSVEQKAHLCLHWPGTQKNNRVYVSVSRFLYLKRRYVMRKPELNNSFDQKGLSYKQAGQ